MIFTNAAYFSAYPQTRSLLPEAVRTPYTADALRLHHWQILVLNHGGCHSLLTHRVPCTCDTLLLPEAQAGAVTQLVAARQVISAGLSPRCSLTFSSFQSSGALVCVQRTLLRGDGSVLDPQEFLLPPLQLPVEEQLLLFGLQMLL